MKIVICNKSIVTRVAFKIFYHELIKYVIANFFCQYKLFHKIHKYVFFIDWTAQSLWTPLICLFSCLLSKNSFSHISHLNSLLTGSWLDNRCFLRFPFNTNDLSQKWHLKSFLFPWTAKVWYLKPLFPANVFPHSSQTWFFSLLCTVEIWLFRVELDLNTLSHKVQHWPFESS